MTDPLIAALSYAEDNQAVFLDNLKEFVSIPSVSTDPLAKPEIEHAANWVAGQLRRLGAKKITVYPTAGHPVVYGEIMQAGEDKPVAIIYGHYDVQPAEPLELWQMPPFQPSVRGDYLYGRGASDMKGQVMVSLQAIESLLKCGGLGLNLKFLFEGEEEIGSPNLAAFIADNQDLLSCDFAINPDSGMLGADIPTIPYSLRGLAYFEVRLTGPVHDLHSGLYGGVIHNPAQVLCELIAGMHDDQGRITLPGFYDAVREISDQERQELSRLPMDSQFYLGQTGASKLWGEASYSPVERIGARPTLEINGLLSGFTGEGAKTVLPAQAMAKISMRLVPDQDPDRVEQQLVEYFEKNVPETTQWEVIKIAGGYPSMIDINHPAVICLRKALEDTWGIPPVFKREGGSVPVVAQMQKILGIESVLTGFGLPDDNLHAPNERFHLPTYRKGIQAFIRFLNNLGAMPDWKRS